MHGFEQMALLLVFAASVILQFIATGLAVRMTRRGGLCWWFLAFAMALMGFRRLVSFAAVLGGEVEGVPVLSAEFIALLISILMVTGLLLLSPFMESLYRAQEEVKVSRRQLSDETRFRELFENMTSGVVVYEPVDGGFDFVVVDLNPAAAAIEKMSREHVVGNRVSDVFSGAEEFGLLEVLRRVWRSGHPERFPARHYRDGCVAGWRDHYVYRRPCGEVVSVYDDVTEEMVLREEINHREHKFRLFYERAPLPYQSLDRNGYILEVNPAWLQMFGYKRREVIGRDFGDLMAPESRQRFREQFPRFEETGRIFDESYDLKKQDGALVTVALDGRVQRGPDGSAVQTYCIMHPAAVQGQRPAQRV